MEINVQKPSITKSPLFLVAPFFFLGTAMVAMKFVIPYTTPLFLAGFRLLPAGLLILLFGAIAKLPQPKTLKAWLWIILFGIVDGAMFQGFLSEGLVHTGAGLGSVLIDTQPLVVALLSRFLLGDIIGPWGWAGLAIGIFGVALCGLPEEFITSSLQGNFAYNSFEPQALLQSGELLMILAALAMSFGTIIVRYVKEHADPLVGTGWHMIIGSIPLIILSGLFESNQTSNLSTIGWSGLAYATIFGTAITYGMFFYLAATGNVTSISALIFLTPVFALLFANLTLGESLTPLQWCGVVLTLISVYLVNQRKELAAKFGNSQPNLAITNIQQETSEIEVVEPKSESQPTP